MSWAEEPMTTFTVDEWRAYKRAMRRLNHVHRLQQVQEPDPKPWLAAVARDDRRDPYEQAAPALEVTA
jgi:hypothetical protein